MVVISILTPLNLLGQWEIRKTPCTLIKYRKEKDGLSEDFLESIAIYFVGFYAS